MRQGGYGTDTTGNNPYGFGIVGFDESITDLDTAFVSS
jgi:hypothetical protein